MSASERVSVCEGTTYHAERAHAGRHVVDRRWIFRGAGECVVIVMCW